MDKIIVTVAGQVRGTNAQTGFGFTADEGTITNTWGLQPGTALLSWVQAGLDTRVILPLAALTIELGEHVFYGLCEEAVQVTSHEGRTLTQRFLDSRMLLQYDLIYAQFNLRDARMVNGRYLTRYRHLLPANYNARALTFTNEPYTAREILEFCFRAATVESPWWRVYNTGSAAAALNQPVYDVDCESGRKLGTLVMDLLDQALTDLTHDPVTGKMTAIPDGRQMPGNGYAVVQGYGVNLEGLRLLHPETFNLENWKLQQNLWQAMPYQVDDSGEDGKFVRFDVPVVVSADQGTSEEPQARAG